LDMLAEEILARLPQERPIVLLICGLPGAGKSWLARRLQPHLKAELLQTDRIRRELFPVRRYTHEESEAVYRELLRRMESAVREGKSAILDGTYLVTRSREEVWQLTRRLGVPLVIILATAPEEAIKERFSRRGEGENDFSEATYAVYLEMKGKLQTDPGYSLPRADQGLPLLVVDTEAEAIVADMLKPRPRAERGDSDSDSDERIFQPKPEPDLDGLYRAFRGLEAVIFDMDGVMVRSEEAWIRSEREFLESRGIHLGEEGWRDFQLRHAPYLAGRNQAEAARFYQQVFNLQESVEEIRRARMAIVRRYFAEVELMPGVRELLQVLYAAGLKIGLASGSPMELIELILHRYELGRYFQAVISGDEIHEGKPNPAIYLLAARELGVTPGKTLVFEDAPNGVKAAKAAGMICVYLPNPALPWAGEVPADFVLKKFTDLDLKRLRAALLG